jgi:hypothetical protein
MLKASLVAAVAALALIVPATAAADPNVLTPEDQSFMQLLDSNGLLFNFKLQRYQGQRYCREVMDGESSLEAKESLMRDGAYSFDVANGIGSTAGVAYCLCASSIAMIGSPYPGQCSQWETAYARAGEN